MTTIPDVLWLSVSPSLQRFDQPLIRYLSRQVSIAQWDYQQSQDEPSSLDVPLVLLHDYLKSCDRPIHLIGHSMGGVVGLLYARKYPERVKSLTLMAVGVHPAIDWQAHYYVQLQLLRCSRQMVLTQMVYNLFGDRDRYATRGLIRILEQDLKRSPSPHSLFKRVSLPPGGVPVPLMACGSRDDIVVDPNELQGWVPLLKESDRVWECIDGGHFFHNFHPQSVGEQIFDFWQSVSSQSARESSLGRC